MTMRAMPFLAAVLATVVHTSAAAQSAGAKVDPALEAQTKKFAQAFDSADPKTFASFFTTDATLMNPMGKVAHGPAEIEKLFGQSGRPIFTGSRSTLTVTGTRRLTPDTVWVDVDHSAENVHLPDGGNAMTSHIVLLAKKQGADWKWMEMRAFRPVPPGAAASGQTSAAPAK